MKGICIRFYMHENLQHRHIRAYEWLLEQAKKMGIHGGSAFRAVAALFGLSHEVIDQAQYSYLVAAVIGSAVVPTLIANAFFLPRHLLHKESPSPETK